jgi:hypothetical protein
MRFGGNVIAHGGSTDLFWARYDVNGNHLFSEGRGGPADDAGEGVGRSGPLWRGGAAIC